MVRDYETPFERVLDPGHPDADANGFVSYPNVNTCLLYTSPSPRD